MDEINLGLKKGEYILIPKPNGMNIVGKLRNIKADSSKFYSILKHLSANGIKDLQALDLDKYFSYPKPVSLVQELVAGITIFPVKMRILFLISFLAQQLQLKLLCSRIMKMVAIVDLLWYSYRKKQTKRVKPTKQAIGTSAKLEKSVSVVPGKN